MSNQFNLSDDAIRLIYGLLQDYQLTLLHVGEMPDKLEELELTDSLIDYFEPFPTSRKLGART
jgi:hypothetical protein